MIKPEKNYQPLPLAYYTIPLILILLSGVVDSLYLSISHYRNYTDPAYQSFCALSRSINCDTVSQSRYSIFLNVPVPVWGIVGYLFYSAVFSAALISKQKCRLWALLVFIGGLFTLYSFFLAWISAFIIKSYCIMCVVSYGITMLITLYSWLISQRFGKQKYFASLKQDLFFIVHNAFPRNVLILFFVGGICLSFFVPQYWRYTFPANNPAVSTGLTKDYSPWIGAKNDPELIVHEYSDYLCFQCKKMHHYLRNLIHTHPDKIRLVHHNYPMDHKYNPVVVDKPFHVGAGKLALFAIYASSKENFWEINDKLYSLSRLNSVVTLELISKTTGIDVKMLSSALINKSFHKKLAHDIKQGLKLRLTATPSYHINGKVYEGIIPPEILKNSIE